MRLVSVFSAVVLLAGAAHAADVLVPVRAVPSPPPPAAFDWSGLYVGLHGGYSWGRSSSAYDDPNNTGFFDLIPIDPMNPAGWYGGVQAGANLQSGNFVFGIEADAAVADIHDTIHDLASELAGHGADNTVTSKTDWAGSVRGRLGFAFDRTLFYGTAGLAWAHTTVSATDGPISDDATLLGWTAGGGVEQAISRQISVKVEYLYSSFGNHTWFEGEDYQSTGSSTSNTVRGGVNFHF